MVLFSNLHKPLCENALDDKILSTADNPNLHG
jgi:hypothetical protein